MQQQAEREIGCTGMVCWKVEQVDEDGRAMRPPEWREVIDRIDTVTHVLGDLPKIFRIAIVEDPSIPTFEFLLSWPERRRFEMEHERLVRDYRGIAVPVDPADQVVLLVVAGAVDGIEKAQLTKDRVPEQ